VIAAPRWRVLADLLAGYEQELHGLVRAPHPDVLSRDVKAGERRADLFFRGPTDAAKLWTPLSELTPELGLQSRKELHVACLGRGAGAAIVGAFLHLASVGFRGRVHATILETDPGRSRDTAVCCNALSALPDSPALLARISGTPGSHPGLSQGGPSGRFKTERFDLVVLMDHSATDPVENTGKTTSSLILRIMEDVVKRTGFLVVIDRAEKSISRTLVAAGGELESEGHRIFAPVPFDPILAQLSRGHAFSFHSTPVPLTPYLQSVAGKARLDRHEVNYSYLSLSPSRRVLALPDFGPNGFPGRVMSFPKRVKNGFHYFVSCRVGMIVAFAPLMLPGEGGRARRLPFGTVVRIQERR